MKSIKDYTEEEFEADCLHWSLSSAHKVALEEGKKVFIDLDEEMIQAYGITKYSDIR